MLANRGHPEPPTTSPPTIIIPSSSSNISPVANRISQSSDFNDDQDEDCLLQNANQSGRKRCCPFVPSSISAGRPGRWSNFSQQLRAQETGATSTTIHSCLTSGSKTHGVHHQHQQQQQQQRQRPLRSRDESYEHGLGKPGGAERRRDPARDVQSDAEEDSGHAAVPADRGTGQLRPRAERVLLRSAPGGVRAGAQLLPANRLGDPNWVYYSLGGSGQQDVE
ncbi:voltage-gated potassium channel [Culex quinquefasciatus]|uniref:Voltage-gated potassium channel n=1 Tax=Culex quinquefasciatus TaxID=7176 RepID=B0XEU4_CULQU|nr:voltage-gated potassium channel [Culex quinquefasciatus]|eukprot:XP_001868166.1 voltage-gated potassium channel [Culex quinquefasciatus]